MTFDDFLKSMKVERGERFVWTEYGAELAYEAGRKQGMLEAAEIAEQLGWESTPPDHMYADSIREAANNAT